MRIFWWRNRSSRKDLVNEIQVLNAQNDKLLAMFNKEFEAHVATKTAVDAAYAEVRKQIDDAERRLRVQAAPSKSAGDYDFVIKQLFLRIKNIEVDADNTKYLLNQAVATLNSPKPSPKRAPRKTAAKKK